MTIEVFSNHRKSNYLMNYTRPDIAYVVSILNGYTCNPSDDH